MAGNPQDAWRKRSGGGTPSGRSGSGLGREAVRKAGSGGKGPAKWFLAALITAAIVAVFVGLFAFTGKPPDPLLLAIPVTRYSDPDWPANVRAEDDLRAFRDRFGADSAQAFQDQEKGRILRELNRIADESRASAQGRPIVVHLSMLGTVDRGTPYLLPGDARPDDPSTWLKLEEILQPLRKTDAARLLILDIRPATAARAVLPTEDVNESLTSALEKLQQANDLPFLVLLADTPREGASLLHGFRKTLFGFALAHGAGGAADGWGEGGNAQRSDGRVSAKELASYVTSTVSRMAKTLNLPTQTPKLLGTGNDFLLLPVDDSGPAPLPTIPDAEPYPAFFADLWKEADARRTEGLSRRAPRAEEEFLLSALTAERRWYAGIELKSIQDRYQPLFQDFRDLKAKRAPLKTPTISVARAQRTENSETKVKEVEASLRSVLDLIRALDEPKADEFQGALAAAIAKPVDAAPFEATAIVLWDTAGKLENPSPSRLKRLLLIAKAMNPPPKLTELSLLEMITNLHPDLLKRYPAGTLATLIRTTRSAEEALAGDGRAVAWTRARLDKAETLRREALAILTYTESPDEELRAANEKLDQARLESIAVRDANIALESAFEEWEESRSILLDMTLLYPHDLAGAPKRVDDLWSDWTRQLAFLQQSLVPPAESKLPDADRLHRAVDASRASRAELTKLIGIPNDPTPAILEKALAWPRWTAGQRSKIVNDYQAVSKAQAEKLLAEWPTKPVPPETPSGVTRGAIVRGDTLRDLKRLTELSVLAEQPGAPELRTALESLSRSPADDKIADLYGKVRSLGCRAMPKAFRDGTLSVRARLGGFVHPHDLSASPRVVVDFDPNPELPFIREQTVEFLRWCGEKRRAEAKLLLTKDPESPQKAVKDYAATLETVARSLDWTP